MDNNSIILIIIIIWLLWITYKILNSDTHEGFNSSSLNNEALQNIASIYNQGKLTVTELEVTGKSTLNEVDLTGNSNISGPMTVSGTTSVSGATTLSGAFTASGTTNLIKENEVIVLSNEGTGNHEEFGKYIGLCGHSAECPAIGFNLSKRSHLEDNAAKWRGRLKIVKY